MGKKFYKVQQKITLLMETTVEADSKADAKRMLEDGAGEFDESMSISFNPVFKVLGEIDIDEHNEMVDRMIEASSIRS